MSDPLCPVTKDGRHKRKVWQDKERKTSGLVCVLCHRTWHHVPEGPPVGTYDLFRWPRADVEN